MFSFEKYNIISKHKGEITLAKGKSGLIDSKYLGVVKGIITSIIMCVLAILIYAVVLKTFALSDKTIPYFNQIIKIAGIILTAYYSVKKSDNIFFGLLGGVAFVLIVFLLFSLINGSMGSIAILGSDVVMGAVIGLVFAIISTKLMANKEQTSRR